MHYIITYVNMQMSGFATFKIEGLYSAIEHELIGPLHQILKDKCRASAKCDYLRSCLARNTYPKGVTSSVSLKISDAPKDLQEKWTLILKECTKQLTMTLVKFHQGQAAHQKQLAETLIHNVSHTIIPEYITTVPDITSKIESSIDELMCETSLIDKKILKIFLQKGHTQQRKQRPQKNKKLYHPHPSRRHLNNPRQSSRTNQSKRRSFLRGERHNQTPSSYFELLQSFEHFSKRIRSLPRVGPNIIMGKKFPLKRIPNYTSKRTLLSTPKLEGVLEAMKIEISQIPITDNIPSNLSRGERKALQEIICDKDLIVNKADKGSTIVVQNRTDYIITALEQLNDPITYRLLDGNPTSCICANIVFLLQDFLKKGLLNKETVAYCSPPKMATRFPLFNPQHAIPFSTFQFPLYNHVRIFLSHACSKQIHPRRPLASPLTFF